jgi:hypothetical protein
MNHLRLEGPDLIWYNTLHFGHDVLASSNSIKQQIDQDLRDNQIDRSCMINRKLVVCFKGEGHDPHVIKPLIDQLKIWPVVDLLVIFSACVDVDSLPYRAISHRTGMIDHNHWINCIRPLEPTWQVDYKFLCLMRRPSPSRARLANKLLQSVDSVKLSFGSMNESAVLSQYQPMIPGRNLPILIDGIVDRKSIYNEHDQSNSVFHNCLFNIVVESSSQTDPGIWRSQFVTEKTFKAFGLRQIPIWMAVPGLVARVRAMGFDLFDDIIDHSYDTVLDENQRQDQLMQQVAELDLKLSLDQCRQLRNQLAPRLEHNFQLLDSLSKNGNIEFESLLKQFRETVPQELWIFGDSWPYGSELNSNDVAYGELLGQQLSVGRIKNYSAPGTGISHMILQLQQAIKKNQSSLTKKIAVFFLSGQERFMCYHDDQVVNLSSRGPRINPENNAGVMQHMNDLYYKYFYTDQMRDFFMNTNLLTLQAMCRHHKIDDYYIAGWQQFNFWTEVDHDKVYNQGRTSCQELLDMVFDNRDGVVRNNAYFTPNISHPNQLGHQRIADTLFEWIKSKHVDTGLNNCYNSNKTGHPRPQ